MNPNGMMSGGFSLSGNRGGVSSKNMMLENVLVFNLGKSRNLKI